MGVSSEEVLFSRFVSTDSLLTDEIDFDRDGFFNFTDTEIPSSYIVLEDEDGKQRETQQKPSEDVQMSPISLSPSPEPPRPFIGPVLPTGLAQKSSDHKSTLPPSLDAQLKSLKRANGGSFGDSPLKKKRLESIVPTPSPSPPAPTVSSDCAPSCSGLNGALNGSAALLKKQRKRLLSERGEREAAYPVIDQLTRDLHSWKGFALAERRAQRVPAGNGLINPSNDCFMNAVLQSLVHTVQLCRFVREKHNPNFCSVDRCGLCAFHSHIGQALSAFDNPVRAKGMKTIVKKILPCHYNGNQEDAHETLCLLLDSMEPPLPPRNPHIPASLPSKIPKKNSNNAIEQIFGGTARNRIKCRACNTFTINYERIRELNVSMTMRPQGNDGSLRLTSLLQDHFSKDFIDEFHCPNCKQKSSALRFTRVLRAPSVLIVQLKRFDCFGRKVRTPVVAELNIDLQPYMVTPAEPVKYSLNSMIVHLGSSLDYGHYISVTRGFDNSWFVFDDESRQRIKPSAVSSHNQPYVLFYTRSQPVLHS